MDAAFYVNEILEKTLLPFINSRFPDGHRFQQDNNPKYTSRLAQDFITRSGVNWWKTPPESQDLNPIELIWHKKKHFLRTTEKPSTKDELLSGITRFWQERMTAEKCTKYIEHLQKVVPFGSSARRPGIWTLRTALFRAKTTHLKKVMTNTES